MRQACIALAIWFLMAGTSAAQATRITAGSTLPLVCATGNLFYKTSTSPGFYTCEANVWTGPYPTSPGSGTVTTTGSPASGNLVKFSGALSITSADLTGDITTAGTVASTIANDVVTYAKIQNISAASRVLGRGSASGAGDTEELTLGGGLALAGTVLNTVGGTGGSGNIVNTTAFGAEPGSPNTGDLDLYTQAAQISRYSGAAWVPWGPLWPLTDPTLQTFAWINQGSATVSTTNGGIALATIAEGSVNLRIREKATPSTPYTITAAFLPAIINAGGMGLSWRDSVGGRIEVLQAALNTAAGAEWTRALYTFSSVTGFNGTVLSAKPAPAFGLVWLQCSDDGTNRIVRYSADGYTWIELYSELRSTYLTPDRVGFYLGNTNADYPISTLLISWKETSP